MNGMAEVIAAHWQRVRTPDGLQFQCICGVVMANGVPHIDAAHVAEELAKAGYGKLPVTCECGAMQAGKVESCKLHPNARLRTREEMSVFAKAFDAVVEASKSKS